MARRRPRRTRRPLLCRRRRRTDPKLIAVAVGLALIAAAKVAPEIASAAPVPAASTVAVAFRGPSSGCVLPDPTSNGCITPATAHGLDEIARVFGSIRKGPNILSVSCWDAHTWNPTSDHPKGRACDVFFGKAGVFTSGANLDHGWAVAKWLRANADALRIRYVIWQGRIWQADSDSDSGGWGRKYNGGGIYDPTDATGGHYDHLHFSVQP